MGAAFVNLVSSFWRWLTGRGSPKDMPGWVYVTQVLWALGLLGLFLAFVHGNDRLDLPHAYGRVPVEAPWLGAVGGLLVSLGGIAYFSRGRWEPRFNYWHPIKPLMGAASGAVACLLVIVLVRTATGSNPPTIDTTALDAAAFIFGYAEKSFRELIKGVTDVFLKPGGTRSGPTGTGRAGGAGGAPTAAATATGQGQADVVAGAPETAQPPIVPTPAPAAFMAESSQLEEDPAVETTPAPDRDTEALRTLEQPPAGTHATASPDPAAAVSTDDPPGQVTPGRES